MGLVLNYPIYWLNEVGAVSLFGFSVLRSFLRYGVRYRQLIDQVYQVGVKTLSVALLSGGFVGAIMAVQINLQLADFGAQGFLGGLSTSVTIRDVGPLIIAFVLSGKVGAYTSAELGTMRVTEQMDAIRCLGANPIETIVVPRMVAVILSSFLLLIIGLMVSIVGGILISSFQLGMNSVLYVQNISKIVTGWSLATGIVKSFVLGSLIGVISCYHGYTATGGAVGVGEKVKKASVQCMVSIIVADFIVSAISSFFADFFHLGEF